MNQESNQSAPYEFDVPPPFKSGRESGLFIVSLVFFLALPLLLARTHAIKRVDMFRTAPNTVGDYGYIYHQIYEEKPDIDILFIGSSFLYNGIDGPEAKKLFSRALGRDVNVAVFGTNFESQDIRYYQLSELLAHRKVKLVIINAPDIIGDREAVPSIVFFHLALLNGEDPIYPGLSVQERATVYAGAVLGAPRHLMTLIRRDRVEPPNDHLGSFLNAEGYLGAPFVKFDPQPPVNTLRFYPQDKGAFNFGEGRFPSYQLAYFLANDSLLRKNGCKVLFLRFPIYNESSKGVIEERMDYEAILKHNVEIAGIIPQDLFRGLSQPDIDKLYYNGHMNVNGAKFFTRAITPQLARYYEEKVQH